MNRRCLKPQLALMLGIAAMMVAGLIAIPNGSAQQPEKLGGRKGLREKIVTLHGDVAFLKLEMEISHQKILDKIKEDAELPSAFASMERMIRQVPPSELVRMFGEILDDDGVGQELGPDVTDRLRKALDTARQKGGESDQRKAIGEVFREAKKLEGEKRRAKLSALKQDYAALARELAGKKLDLDDAEHQYRESR